MAVDPFSPIAPARIRVLLVPAGKIKRSRFMTFVERLQPESAIRLGDVTPDPRPDRTMFSPLRNPDGMLLYYFTTSMPPASYISLSPFELFREPLMVLGIADGEEYQEALDNETANAAEDKTNVALKREELNEVVDVMREEYPRAVVHKLLLFDSGLPSLPSWLPEETMLVPPLSESTMTTMKTVMCDLSSLLLAEMTGLARSLQALPEISISSGPSSPNPGNRSPFSLVRQSSFGFGAAENSLSRSGSPAQPVQIQQLQKQEATGRRGSLGLRLSPPTENPSRAITPPELSPAEDLSSGRSGETTPTDSAPTRPRALQRFSIQGFGSGSMEEKARLSNACRHDLVDAQVCLMAGHVLEGLKRSHETFLKAEMCNEHLVMAKALEQMLICCLILVGHEQEFEIPTSCTPATKGMPVSGTIANVLEWIPELTSRIMGFYRLSFKSDSGHLLTLVDAESKIRVSNLLTAIERLGKTFTPKEFLERVESQSEDKSPPVKGISTRVVHISNILSEAIDSATSSAAITDTERATIYAEAAGCLAKLGLSRKRAFVVTLLMDILVPALLQARKLGAAEMGIHPAAGMLSGGLVQPSDKKYGETVFIFLEQFVREYGVQARSRLDAHIDGGSEHLRSYGSLVLKAEVLRRCINVCEAMADLQGVLDFSSSFLSIIAPQEPLEETDPGFRCLMPREDQHRLVQNIHRSLEAAKALGMEQTEATFWYDHLVHSVKYDSERAGRDLTLRKNVSADDSQQRARFEHQAFGDKNKGSAVVPLVAGEPSEFIVTLRNPFAFPLDVESIKLVSAKGVEIACPPNLTYQIPPCAVQPLRVPVVATVPDVHDLVKLRVKVRQCRERDFDVSVSRTTVQEVEKMKEVGHSVAKTKKSTETSRPGTATTTRPVSRGMPVLPSVTVVPQQPSLAIKTNLIQDTLSLLEGETKSFKVTVSHDEKDRPIKANILHMLGRNNTVDMLRISRRSSNLPSQIYELGQDIGRAEWKSGDFKPSSELEPNKTMTFTVDVFGVPGLNKGTVGVEYAAADQPPELGDYWVTSRVSQEIAVTVQPSVTASHFSILPGREAEEHIEAKFPNADLDDHFVLVFDFLNISDRELSIEAWYDDANMPRQPVLELTSRSDFLKPGQASSMAVLLPKIYLSYSNDAIPAAQDRQFVLTDTQQLSREERMCFWYRQKLLQCLQCRWRDRTGTRHGLVNCAALQLTPESVGYIMSILSIGMSIPNAQRADSALDPDTTTLVLNADAHPALATTALQPLYLLRRGDTATVRVELRNTSAAAYAFTVAPVVRVQAPHLDPDDSIRTRVAQQLLAWVRAVQLDPYKTVVLESDIVAPFGVAPGFIIELGLEVADGPFPASHVGSLCCVQVIV